MLLSGGDLSSPHGAARVPDSSRVRLTLIALLATFALQVWLVFAKSVNWDEFFHFQLIHELADGSLGRVLQVFYLRLFTWLIELPIDSISQLMTGRLVILIVTPITAFAIYGLVRAFAARSTALLCALAYTTGGYIFLHSFSFRPDGIITAMLMASLWLYMRRPLAPASAVLIALLLAVAAMMSIKSIFYAPAFLGLFFLKLDRGEDPRRLVGFSMGILVAAALIFLLLLTWHSWDLKVPASSSSQGTLKSAGTTVFSAGLFPQLEFLVTQIAFAPFLAGFLAAAPFLWRRRLKSRAQIVTMAGFILPIVTVVFYRNSYPYNFVFILAPACVTIFPAVEFIERRRGGLLLAIILLTQAAMLTLREPMVILKRQRDLVSASKQIFPEPIPYIDFCGVVGGYPRVYRFLTSGWGLQAYRGAGRPLLAEQLARRPAPLLIDNHPVLRAAMLGRRNSEELLPEDARLIRDNYIPHWGLIWVAGKRIEPGTAAIRMDMAMGGKYTLERAPIVIDGRRVVPGQVISISRGIHEVIPDQTLTATLRWGDHLAVPPGPGVRAPVSTIY